MYSSQQKLLAPQALHEVELLPPPPLIITAEFAVHPELTLVPEIIDHLRGSLPTHSATK